MTTETKPHTLNSGVGALLGAASLALMTGLLVALLGLVIVGRTAAESALIGAAAAVGVFAFGAFVVNAVAGIMPRAALMVALLTYTLQVVVLGLVFAVLGGLARFDEALERRWLAAALIASTLAWLAAHIAIVSRQRIPVYDPANVDGSKAVTASDG
jgi:ATP synthase protein I